MSDEPNPPEVSPRAREAYDLEVNEQRKREYVSLDACVPRGSHVQRALDAVVAEKEQCYLGALTRCGELAIEVARLTKELAAAQNGCEQLRAVLAIRDKQLAEEREKRTIPIGAFARFVITVFPDKATTDIQCASEFSDVATSAARAIQELSYHCTNSSKCPAGDAATVSLLEQLSTERSAREKAEAELNRLVTTGELTTIRDLSQKLERTDEIRKLAEEYLVQRDSLRTQLASVTRERDEAKADHQNAAKWAKNADEQCDGLMKLTLSVQAERDTLAQRVAELEKALQSLQKNENQS